MTTSELRRLGAALGAASGPVGTFGQAWSGIGDAGLHVAVLFTLLGALAGALTFPIFWSAPAVTGTATAPGTAPAEASAPTPERRFGPGFGALFGFAIGVVTGAIAAFPMGAVMGSLGGAVGGALGALVWNRLPGRPLRALTTACVAAGAGFLAVWIWVR